MKLRDKLEIYVQVREQIRKQSVREISDRLLQMGKDLKRFILGFEIHFNITRASSCAISEKNSA